MRKLSNADLESCFNYPELADTLAAAFREDIEVPLRHHHDFPGPEGPNTLLLMPAWQKGKYLGVKLVTVCPENSSRSLPTIQGLYLLFDAATGQPLAQMDAKTLTNWRTAAASALASRFLSRPDSIHLLMVGTGALAPYLIQAHAALRPVTTVSIWGRNTAKAGVLARQLNGAFPRVRTVEDLAKAVPEADIISCATLSREPLIKGEWLRAGQHLDLVGSFRPDMREADDVCIRRSEVFVDTLEGATRESGDIVIPLQQGTLKAEDIHGDLFDLCRQKADGRREEQAITLFKSVGHALEDLAAAALAYEK